jgi:hypothetical protein
VILNYRLFAVMVLLSVFIFQAVNKTLPALAEHTIVSVLDRKVDVILVFLDYSTIQLLYNVKLGRHLILVQIHILKSWRNRLVSSLLSQFKC